MKKLLILSASLLMFITSQAIHKVGKRQPPRIVKIVPQGTNEGMKMYSVTLSDGRVMEYMYRSEIREAKRTGIWKYNEMLEFKSTKSTYHCSVVSN